MIIKAVRDLAEKYPETIYPRHSVPYCKYTEGDCGPGSGCLIGQALQACGMKEKAEWADAQGKTSVMLLGLEVSSDELAWLKDVQLYQDRGRTWKKAIDRADFYAGLRQTNKTEKQ